MIADIEMEFVTALANAGLALPPGTIIPADSRMHRFHIAGDTPGKRNGWAVLHADGAAHGVAGSWRTGARIVWTPDGEKLSVADRRRYAEIRRKAEVERAVAAKAVAEKAQRLFDMLPAAPQNHLYLAKKKVDAGPCRIMRSGNLVVPVINVNTGQITSLQFITPGGEKRFLFGGAVAAGHCVLGNLDADGPILVGEGFATVSSVHGATGFTSVVAFNAGNLKAVADALRKRFPTREIIICADNDTGTEGNPGVTQATAAARLARARLAVPDTEGDFNDLHVRDGLAAVRCIIEAAALVEPFKTEKLKPTDEKTGEFDSAEVERLGKLTVIEYEKQRHAAAEKLGIRATVLDKLVARERTKDDTGSAVLFPAIEPWIEPVNGAELLTAISDVFERHMVLPAGAADAMALWSMHAHAHDLARISPILALTSPTPECGKTTALTLTGAFVPKPLPASNITAAALFRAVEKWAPTLLVDEADTFLRDSDELRGVINSGHNRAAAFVIRTTGDNHDPARFTTWAPKAIALIGKLPATLASRAIHIELRRMAPAEKKEPVRADRLQHLVPLTRQAARWVMDKEKTLVYCEPDMPVTLTGRRADNWRPLLAIAEVAGGDWPERARKSAEALTVTGAGDTAGILLLQDIRRLFDAKDIDRIGSGNLAGELAEMLDRPWPEWSKGKPITQRGVAKLLEPFAVSPATIRTEAGTPKGYRLEQFTDAFSRYLPPDPPHRHKSQKTAENTPTQSATPIQPVADENPPKPAEIQPCGGVADRKPQNRREWRPPWASEDPLNEVEL